MRQTVWADGGVFVRFVGVGQPHPRRVVERVNDFSARVLRLTDLFLETMKWSDASSVKGKVLDAGAKYRYPHPCICIVKPTFVI